VIDPTRLVRVIGVDPGDECGLACVEYQGNTWRVVRAVGVRLSTQKGQRALGQFLDECLALGPLDGLAMEEPGYVFLREEFRKLPPAKQVAVACKIAVGQGRRRGQIEARAMDRGIKVLDDLPQSHVKATVACGGASKTQMIAAVRLRTGFDAPSEHIADGVAVACTAIKHLLCA
jgi:Holliday junction resolvasome RuvABC endonuclease subunit